MKNSSATTVRTITSWEAQTITGIPAPAIVFWIQNGHLPAKKTMKGEREVYVFDPVDLILLLLSPAAGKHQIPVTEVPLADIALDPTYQLRAKTKLSVVREYTQLVAAGPVLPSVQLVRIPAGGNGSSRLVLTDGWHRYYAHQHAGLTHIRAQIVDHWGEAEAFALALRANSSHGLARTEADKRQLVTAMLARPEYATMTSRKLVAICGVSHNTICRYRRRTQQPQAQAQPVAEEQDPGTPRWIASQIAELATKLRVTHPDIAESVTAQVSKLT